MAYLYNEETISQAINTKWAGKTVHFAKETDSTNSWIKRLAKNGAEHGTLAELRALFHLLEMGVENHALERHLAQPRTVLGQQGAAGADHRTAKCYALQLGEVQKWGTVDVPPVRSCKLSVKPLVTP